MHGFGIILIPAGIIAAVICFRWARTLAYLAFACLMVWFLAACAAPGYHYEHGSFTQTPNVVYPNFQEPAYVPPTAEEAARYRKNAAANEAAAREYAERMKGCLRQIPQDRVYPPAFYGAVCGGNPWWTYSNHPP